MRRSCGHDRTLGLESKGVGKSSGVRRSPIGQDSVTPPSKEVYGAGEPQ